ncbi:MAG: hypothetical protein HQ519_15550 [Planctomycetes bacterium]|nr:hypothetical protein [Planctomycetota bacterium]
MPASRYLAWTIRRTFLTFLVAAFACISSCSKSSESHLPELVDFELMDPVSIYRQGLKELKPLLKERVPFHFKPESHPCTNQCQDTHLASTIIPLENDIYVLEVKVVDFWYEEWFFVVLYQVDRQNMLILGSGMAAMGDVDNGTFEPWLDFYSGDISLSQHQENQGTSLSGSIHGKFFDGGRPREIEGPLHFHAQMASPLEENETPSDRFRWLQSK